jgi:hypothetical protein
VTAKAAQVVREQSVDCSTHRPMVRIAWTVITTAGKVSVVEATKTLDLQLSDGISKRVLTLTLAEAREFADRIHQVCSRIENRPEWES